MHDPITSALRIARHYGQRYAEGGMTLKRTEPFPEAPEGYEYYAPADDSGPAPKKPAPEPAANEYDLQRQQAEALPTRPPVAMEPDLNAAQMREQDIPEGYAINDAGYLFNKETGKELPQTRRSNMLPFTRTPEGQYEWNMPKVADILGNLGGGWTAPVSGAETILGAGARLPRRRVAPTSGQSDLDTFFKHASPSEVEHLTGHDLAMLESQLYHSGDDWVHYSNANPELWDALMARLDKRNKPEMEEAYRAQSDAPPQPAQRNFSSLDELEKAYDRVTEQARTPVRTAPVQGHHPNEPINNGEPISIHDFFDNYGTSDVPRLTDRQFRDLWNDLGVEQKRNSNTWNNIDNYQPELLDTIRSEVRAREVMSGEGNWLDELRRIITANPTAEVRTNPSVAQGPFHSVSEAMDYLRAVHGEDPVARFGFPNATDYIGMANNTAEIRRHQSSPPPSRPRESYQETAARQTRERQQAFDTNYANHLAPHFGDKNEFINTFLAGRNAPHIEFEWNRHYGFVLRGNLVDEAGHSVSEITRDFNPETKTAHHAFWRVTPTKRGTGIVPSVLRNQIDVYKKLGIERVQMNANIDVGSYAWARYGWIPSPEHWNYMARDMKGQLNALNLGDNAKAAVLEILNNPNPKAIWALADAEIPASLAQDAPNIGKVLLKNRSWNGTLYLKDQDTMARFDRYVKERLEKAKKGKDKEK